MKDVRINAVFLAEKMYTAYGAQTGFKNFQGNPMPLWQNLPGTIQEAWVSAALEAEEQLRAIFAEPRSTVEVRAKFKVNSIYPVSQNSLTVLLSPVYGGSPENEKFWMYTPGGHLQMNIDNPHAARHFVQGKEFYLDFIPAEGDNNGR